MAVTQPSFFEAVRRKSTAVSVGGQPFTITTPSLVQFAEFHHSWQIYQDSLAAEDRQLKLRTICDCLQVVMGDSYRDLLPGELDAVTDAISELYQYPPPFLWQLPQPKPEKKQDEAVLTADMDYVGRFVVTFVSILARVFHWDPQRILDMSFYEASAYVQEALIADHEARDWTYSLADVGFKKVGDDWIKQPFPPLPWMRQQLIEPEKKMMPVAMQPAGLIYDLTTYATEGSARRYDIPLKAAAGQEAKQDGHADGTRDVGTTPEAH